MNSRKGLCCTCKSFTKANSVGHWVHICNQATSRCYSEVRTYYSNACSKYDPLQKDKTTYCSDCKYYITSSMHAGSVCSNPTISDLIVHTYTFSCSRFEPKKEPDITKPFPRLLMVIK